MTVPLDTQQDIREMDARGVPRTRISRELGVSRNTVAKYADMRDMSPTAPVAPPRPHPAVDAHAAWMDAVLEEDLGAPRKQRHTAKRIFDRLVDERGYEGSYSSVCRYVARWREENEAPSARGGYLELEWAPGAAQVDFGNFRCEIAGAARDMKLLVLTLPHSNARFCTATFSERSECLCDGLRRIFEWIGRAPALLVLDNATEAGRMVRGRVTESALFSQFRAHYRCASRYCNPYSGNEKGSVENAVGFLRRNLPVPQPSVGSLDELNSILRAGCEGVNAASTCRDGRPTAEALAEDLSSMLALPGVAFDSVRWVRAKSDKRGYVEVCGNRYCAGPAWHDRELVVGVRAGSVEVLDGRGRKVAALRRSWEDGEVVRNPASLIPALVARPRAFGESTIRRDMPAPLVEAIERCDKAGRRRAFRAISRAAESSGFDAACRAAEGIFESGRVPDDASCDLLARRIAGGEEGAGGAALAVYDLLAKGAMCDAG
ncbi:IS21 family transposase [Parafannyhessea umbonata]|nr:IS21 family transposase [Parafannyhessea umbonata]